MPRPNVTLQISLAPSDFRHAQFLLPHQIRTWGNQVDEVLLTVDLHRSKGRFSSAWNEGREGILALMDSIPGVRILPVDYSAPARAKVAAEFFGGRKIPAKDFRGGPYYSYFFALNAATHDFVFHIDSDMFFGGASTTWISEAVAYLQSHPDILVTAPLPGPPAADGLLRSQMATGESGVAYAFIFEEMSTRIFLMSRSRFREKVGALHPRRPPAFRNTIKAIVERNPPADLPEHLFTDAMHEAGMRRRDFLGTHPGVWSLHPPYRCTDFYSRVPDLVRRIEAGDIPDYQRGDHDFNSSMVDWSEALTALKENRWWRRLLRRR